MISGHGYMFAFGQDTLELYLKIKIKTWFFDNVFYLLVCVCVCFFLQKGSKADSNKSKKIFVGGIPHNCGEPELRDYFSRFGVVSR